MEISTIHKLSINKKRSILAIIIVMLTINGTILNANTTYENQINIGAENNNTTQHSIAIGYKNKLDNSAPSIAIGMRNEARKSSTAIGFDSKAKGESSLALGLRAEAEGLRSLAIGTNVNSSGMDSTAIGVGVHAKGESSVSIGKGTEVNGKNTISIGNNNGLENKKIKTTSYEFGATHTITSEHSVYLGNNITGKENNSVYIGENSGDADDSVSKMTEDYSEDTIENEKLKFAGGKTKGVFSIGSKGAERRLQNVAAGWISEKSTDAVNGSQLYSVTKGLNSKITKNTDDIKKIQNKIDNFDSKANGAIAMSMAMANIPQVGDNKLFSIGAAGAYYDKEGGFAIGISGTERSNTFIYKISAGIDTKLGYSVAAGFNLNFVHNRKAQIVDTKCCDLAKAEVKSLKDKINALEKENQEIKDLLKELLKKKPETKEVTKVIEKVVEVPKVVEKVKVVEKKIVVACFSEEKKCVIRGFAVDGRVPNKEEQRQLREVAAKINEFAVSGNMDIIGHTDSDGNDAYNDRLSLKRAKTVSKLLQEAGLKKDLTVNKVSGRGEREPIVPNTTRENKYQNRRVELLFDNVVVK